MTVSELIEILKTLPPDLPAVTGALDESGYSPVSSVEVVTLVTSSEPIGEYQEYDLVNDSKSVSGEPFKAIYIDH
ncbi:MAG: hypothetical protein JJ979_02515 [Roseibium sp.]|nr:hypothetical protein [Roseibium sp.]